MRENRSERKSGSASASPVMECPDLVATCPECGEYADLWTDEIITQCVFCGHPIFGRKQTVH